MKRLQHILCPVDFSETAYQAVKQASFLARMLQADLTLLHVIRAKLPASLRVVHGGDQSSQQIVDQATTDARTMLREAKRKYVPYAITCKSNIRYGKRCPEILAEARERQSDLIILPYPEEQAKPVAFLKELLAEAPCPVLIYRHPSSHEGFRRFLVAFPHVFDFKPMGTYLNDFFSPMIQELHLLAPAETESAYQLINEARWLSSLGLSMVSIQAEAKPKAFPEELEKTAQERSSQLVFTAYPDPKDKGDMQMLSQILKKVHFPLLIWKGEAQ
jgi:universal stress protein A